MKMLDPKKLADYLRNEVHVKKAAELIEKYSIKNAVDAVVIGEDLPRGTVIQIYKKEDGSSWARIQRYSELMEEGND